jgi:hypothetical protein
MSPNPSASPAQGAATTPEALACPNGPADTGHLPLHTEAASDEAAPASSPERPTRADWVRIAAFGIPYASFFLLDIIPTSIFPESWNATLVNVILDSIFLVLALAFFGREVLSTFSYLRRRPVRKIALLFGLWFLATMVQGAIRLSIYGPNPPVAQNQQGVVSALSDSALGLTFAFFVAIGMPLVEEIFYRHILIGKLSPYAPTWLLGSISAFLFAYMHCHEWQDMTMYLPVGIILTLVYIKSGKNIAYSWMYHALNNTIMVAIVFFVPTLPQSA